MKTNQLKFVEIFRWIGFIPLALIAGFLVSFLIAMPFVYFGQENNFFLKPLTSYGFWIMTYWLSANLRPKKLSHKLFKRTWLILTALSVFISLSAFISIPVNRIERLFEIVAPLLAYGMYPKDNDLDDETFLLCINSFLSGFLGLNNKEDKAKGAVGWKLPTVFSAIGFFIYVIIQTFSGLPFAFLSLIGVVCEHTAVCTIVYSKDPSLTFEKYNFIKRFSLALSVFLIGALLVRLGGVTSVQFPSFALSTYLVPPILALTYFPGEELKD